MDFLEEYSLALESSDEDDVVQPECGSVPRPKARRFFTAERRDPFIKLTDQEFKTTFGFCKATAIKLHEMFGAPLEPRNNKPTSLSGIEKILVTLQYLRTNQSYWSVGLMGHVLHDKATVCRTVGSVTEAITDRIRDFIVLPSEAEEEEIAASFFSKFGFPGCRGVLGTIL